MLCRVLAVLLHADVNVVWVWDATVAVSRQIGLLCSRHLDDTKQAAQRDIMVFLSYFLTFEYTDTIGGWKFPLSL